MVGSTIKESFRFRLSRSVTLSLVLAWVGSGCAPAVMVEEEKVAPPPAPRAAEAPAQTPAAKEARLEDQPFRVHDLSVHQERGQTIVRVKFSAPVDQYRHFVLAQPARVVLDVFGEAKRLPRTENFSAETHWLSFLRLSSGDGYLRLVMEVSAATAPAYVIDPENGGLKVVIGPVSAELTAKKDLQLMRAGKRGDVRVAADPTTPAAEAAAGASPTEAAAGPEKKYGGQRISLDFKDADIKNVFRLLAEVSGKNIVVTGDVQRRVTVRLVDVPWDQAMDLLVDTNGLGKDEIGNVIRISTTEQLRRESDARAAAKKAKENEEPIETSYLSVNYAKVKELMDKVKAALSPRGTLVADDRSNTLIVRDIRKGIDDANAIVSRLDTRTPQIQIESNLVETTPSFARALGMALQFDTPWYDRSQTDKQIQIRSSFPAGSPFSGSPFFTLSRSSLGSLVNLSAALSAAENEGNIRILSRPSVVTLNNVASTIQSLRIIRVALPTGTTNIASGTGSAAGSSIATERISVGIVLTVTPQVSSDGFVLMNITVKSSSVAPSPTVTGGTAGVLPFDELTREAIANVLVRDGETIVIGGIMKDRTESSESGIPFFKDIPVLGWLFKNTRSQKDFEELLVFITPRLISAGSENLPTADQLWREQLKKTEGSSG
jgi:type IV pilus assembly protein PilQ